MANERQAEQYRRNQAAIVAKAHEALERAWSRLDSDPKKARQEIVDLLTTLINYFGEMSSLHAVEYYDLMRELAASGKKVPAFRAEMLTSVAMEDVGPSAGWVANAVDEGNRGEALVRAAAASQRLIQQWGRKTLIGNVKRDPAKPRFARVPYGKTCGFCRMLASRGAVYYTAESAGTLGQFHAKCDCQIVPSFNGELPYDPEPYYDEYLAAREEVGGDARKIAAKMDANLAHRRGLAPYRLSPKDLQHIVDGEADNIRKGGHLSGLGRPGKTEFPPTWTRDDIGDATQKTLDAPQWSRTHGDRTLRRREVNRVIIEAATIQGEDGRLTFRHAYPINGDGVVYNKPKKQGGGTESRDLDRSVLDE